MGVSQSLLCGAGFDCVGKFATVLHILTNDLFFAERSESNTLQQGPHRAPLLRGSPEGSGGRPASKTPPRRRGAPGGIKPRSWLRRSLPTEGSGARLSQRDQRDARTLQCSSRALGLQVQGGGDGTQSDMARGSSQFSFLSDMAWAALVWPGNGWVPSGDD